MIRFNLFIRGVTNELNMIFGSVKTSAKKGLRPNFLIPTSVDEKRQKPAQLPNWEAFRTEELTFKSDQYLQRN